MMLVRLQSTTRLVTVNGIQGRVWEGQTESGNDVYAVIVRIATRVENDQEQLQNELRECRAPSDGSIGAFPLRMVL
jgi:hypothetical protein